MATIHASAAMPESRPWYHFDPFRTLILFGVIAVVVIVLAVSWHRRQMAMIPEPGPAASRAFDPEPENPPCPCLPEDDTASP